MITEIAKNMGILLLYFLVAGSSALLIKYKINPGSEIIRKILHIICVLSVLLLITICESWYAAVIVAAAFTMIVYPILGIAERLPRYSSFFAERGKGEVKRSLFLVYFMFIILAVVFWGLLGEGWKYIIAVAVTAWGFGDAAAALIGKNYGKEYIAGRFIDGKKTAEGTLAMLGVSYVAIFATIMAANIFSWQLCLVTALVAAPVCAFAELVTPKGLDTITVPLSTAAVVFAIMYLFTDVLGMFV